jgi:tetratricopeptide (TPR) repeat protein
MDKADLIKRIKQSADYFKEGRVYEALQLIEPLHDRIQHEKVQKLYALSRKKALENFQHLLNDKRYSRIMELYEEFLSDMDDPDFEILVANAREEMQKPEDIHLEITPEDIDPELEDPITEVISASWAAGIASDDTHSAIEIEDADEIDFPHYPESEAPVTAESPVEGFGDGETGMSDETDVNELIQRGVSLYEVGDVQNALRIWRNGLRFDPENVILKEYIANADREVEDEHSLPEDSYSEPISALPESEPDPQELSRIIAMGRAGDVDQALGALDMLEKTSGPSPKLDESREYIRSLSHQYGISTISAKVEELLSSHRAGDAVRILEQHLNEHPEHVELNDLLDTARRRMSDEPPDLNASLELDYDAKDLGGSQQTPEPVQNYSAPPRNKRKQKPIVMVKSNKHMVLIGIVVGILIVLATVAYFLVPQIRLQQFYKTFKKQNTVKVKSATGNYKIKKAQERDYQVSAARAKQFYNEHRYLFAYYLLLHADSIHPLKPEDQQFLNASRNEMLQKVNVSRLRSQAQRYLARGDYAGAIDKIYSILASNPDNIQYKKQLTTLYVKAGIDNVRKNRANDAKTDFDLARILDPANPLLQKHVMVVNRLLSAQIDRHQADEWFVFFQ